MKVLKRGKNNRLPPGLKITCTNFLCGAELETEEGDDSPRIVRRGPQGVVWSAIVKCPECGQEILVRTSDDPLGSLIIQPIPFLKENSEKIKYPYGGMHN